ncbi:DUF4231 domain-containing protein [Kitasatospora sp. NPDC002227]|uniref:DUF4231 domain-containing protein n=1 Tax=Kitasatospora sp. NPDC002227 TaxID=3154773 RepID=UPI00332BF468
MSDASDYWWARLRGPGGGEVPPSVVERISWYELRLHRHRIGHQVSEVVILLLGAAIPAAVAAGAPGAVTGVLGALVVVGTGVRQLFRFSDNWIRTGRYLIALQGEVVSWSTGDGPYRDQASAGALLAARVEALVRAENADWVGMLSDTSRNSPASA